MKKFFLVLFVVVAPCNAMHNNGSNNKNIFYRVLGMLRPVAGTAGLTLAPEFVATAGLYELFHDEYSIAHWGALSTTLMIPLLTPLEYKHVLEIFQRAVSSGPRRPLVLDPMMQRVSIHPTLIQCLENNSTQIRLADVSGIASAYDTIKKSYNPIYKNVWRYLSGNQGLFEEESKNELWDQYVPCSQLASIMQNLSVDYCESAGCDPVVRVLLLLNKYHLSLEDNSTMRTLLQTQGSNGPRIAQQLFVADHEREIDECFEGLSLIKNPENKEIFRPLEQLAGYFNIELDEQPAAIEQKPVR